MVNEKIALAEIEEHEARINEMDIQAAVRFGEFVLLNAPRLWSEASLGQKQRLQQVLFPLGVQFEAGAYRTAQTSILFKHLDEETGQKRTW